MDCAKDLKQIFIFLDKTLERKIKKKKTHLKLFEILFYFENVQYMLYIFYSKMFNFHKIFLTVIQKVQ